MGLTLALCSEEPRDQGVSLCHSCSEILVLLEDFALGPTNQAAGPVKEEAGLGTRARTPANLSLACGSGMNTGGKNKGVSARVT